MSYNLSFCPDVINPRISLVDGRPYMVLYDTGLIHANTEDNQVQEHSNNENASTSYDGYDDEPSEEEDEKSEIDDYLNLLPDLVITGGNNAPYSTLCHVPKKFIGFVLGARKHNCDRIESELNCTINMRDYDRTGSFEIKSNSRMSAIRACRQIYFLMSQIRVKTDFTHFLSFPVNGNELFSTTYHQFVDGVVKSCDVDRHLFQSFKKLHITVALLVLCDQVEIQNAIQAMEQLMDDTGLILKGKPIKVHLSGLEYMNDDPTAVSVLYGKVHPSGDDSVLKIVIDVICKRFVKTGLMKDLPENIKNVKIHVTLMNSRFLQKDEFGPNGNPDDHLRNRKKKTTFDATSILEKFGNYDFGEFTIDTLHLSCPHMTDNDGYYKAAKVIRFA